MGHIGPGGHKLEHRTDALYTLYCYYQSGFTTASALNIKNFPQLCFKLKPYICYLASKISKKQNREYEITIEIDITVIFNNEPETYDAIILVEDYTLMSYPNDDMIFTDSHANMIFTDEQGKKLISKPFMIQVELKAKWNIPENPDNEDEDENDEEPSTIIPLFSTYRTETCIICLVNEPNVLVTDCGHINICTACEKVRALSDCPSCRSTIQKKICFIN